MTGRVLSHARTDDPEIFRAHVRAALRHAAIYGVAGAAARLGVARRTLENWLHADPSLRAGIDLPPRGWHGRRKGKMDKHQGWVLAMDDDARDLGWPDTWHTELGDRIVFASLEQAESAARHAFGVDALEWLSALPVDEKSTADPITLENWLNADPSLREGRKKGS